MLTPEQQAAFVGNAGAFRPGCRWMGKDGRYPYSTSAANEDILAGALRAAWKLRLEKNAKPSRKKRAPKARGRR
jgi:hypothetical protein